MWNGKKKERAASQEDHLLTWERDKAFFFLFLFGLVFFFFGFCYLYLRNDQV